MRGFWVTTEEIKMRQMTAKEVQEFMPELANIAYSGQDITGRNYWDSLSTASQLSIEAYLDGEIDSLNWKVLDDIEISVCENRALDLFWID